MSNPIHYWRPDDTPADRTACGLGIPGLAAHDYSPLATTTLAENVTCPNCKGWLVGTGLATATVRIVREQGDGPLDWVRGEVYPGYLVPAADFRACVKVLRTIRNSRLLADVEVARLLAHTLIYLHLFELKCDQPDQQPNAPADAPTTVITGGT